MWGHGSRPRQAKASGVEKQQYQAHRFFCPQCKKAFTSLPPDLIPHKQYVASEIEGALRHVLAGGKASDAPTEAAESTVWRWVKEFSSRMREWAGQLEARIFKLSGQIPGFIRDSHPLKRLETALSRLPPLPARWPAMVKALWWLKKPHPL